MRRNQASPTGEGHFALNGLLQMHSRLLHAVGLGIVAVAATAMSIPADATASPDTVQGAAAAPTSTSGTCYSNVHHIDTFSTMSQNFPPILDAYDVAAADDVTLRKPCTIASIQVVGSYTSDGAVDSETVTFYKDDNGRPGKVLSSQTKVGTDLGGGAYDIKLKPVTLSKGTYWVSVVANLNADEGGQWYWVNATTERGVAALWENPRGGWQYGCTTWTPIKQCLGAGPSPDLSFALSK